MGAAMDPERTTITTRDPTQRAYEDTRTTDAPVPVPLAYTANEGSITELHIERWHRARTGTPLAAERPFCTGSAVSLTFTHNITPSQHHPLARNARLHRELQLQSER